MSKRPAFIRAMFHSSSLFSSGIIARIEVRIRCNFIGRRGNGRWAAAAGERELRRLDSLFIIRYNLYYME